jgi:hypothetical protein
LIVNPTQSIYAFDNSMQHAQRLSGLTASTATVHVEFDAFKLDEDLARLKELARSGGSGVNLAELSDQDIIGRLLKR